MNAGHIMLFYGAATQHSEPVRACVTPQCTQDAIVLLLMSLGIAFIGLFFINMWIEWRINKKYPPYRP